MVPRAAGRITAQNERLERIRQDAPWLAYLHFAVMVYGAAEKEPNFILIGIASLIIGNILGREPKENPRDEKLTGRPHRHP